jgi:hypothetical protein
LGLSLFSACCGAYTIFAAARLSFTLINQSGSSDGRIAREKADIIEKSTIKIIIRNEMNKKFLVYVVALCIDLSACSGENSETYQVKSVFVNDCIKQESSTRPTEQAGSYCNCVADAVFSNSDISDETKNLMPTLSDKGSKLYQQNDVAMVRGALMSCYTTNFYKKK